MLKKFKDISLLFYTLFVVFLVLTSYLVHKKKKENSGVVFVDDFTAFSTVEVKAKLKTDTLELKFNKEVVLIDPKKWREEDSVFNCTALLLSCGKMYIRGESEGDFYYKQEFTLDTNTVYSFVFTIVLEKLKENTTPFFLNIVDVNNSKTILFKEYSESYEYDGFEEIFEVKKGNKILIEIGFKDSIYSNATLSNMYFMKFIKK